MSQLRSKGRCIWQTQVKLCQTRENIQLSHSSAKLKKVQNVHTLTLNVLKITLTSAMISYFASFLDSNFYLDTYFSFWWLQIMTTIQKPKCPWFKLMAVYSFFPAPIFRIQIALLSELDRKSCLIICYLHSRWTWFSEDYAAEVQSWTIRMQARPVDNWWQLPLTGASQAGR